MSIQEWVPENGVRMFHADEKWHGHTWVKYTDVFNDECVWGEGECADGCPSCKRLDELYAERMAGAKEALAVAIDAVSQGLDGEDPSDMYLIAEWVIDTLTKLKDQK